MKKNKMLVTAAAAMLALSMAVPAWAGPAGDAEDRLDVSTVTPYDVKEETPFQPGEVEENIYTNESLKIKCEFPENWIILSKEDSEKINDMAVDMIEEADIDEIFTLDEDESWQELYASYVSDSINIYVVKESDEEKQYMSMNTVKQLLESQKELFQYGLESMGYEDLELKILEDEDFEFPIENCACMVYNGKMNDQDIWQAQIYIIQGGYDIIITATSFDEDHTMEYLEMFTALEVEADEEAADAEVAN